MLACMRARMYVDALGAQGPSTFAAVLALFGARRQPPQEMMGLISSDAEVPATRPTSRWAPRLVVVGLAVAGCAAAAVTRRAPNAHARAHRWPCARVHVGVGATPPPRSPVPTSGQVAPILVETARNLAASAAPFLMGRLWTTCKIPTPRVRPKITAGQGGGGVDNTLDAFSCPSAPAPQHAEKRTGLMREPLA